MISIDHPVFSHQCSPKIEAKLFNFYKQVFFIERLLLEMEYVPTRFDIGRDDSYQFLIFTIENLPLKAEEPLKERLEMVIGDFELDLIESVRSFKCSNCENLHIIFYIKSLSNGNPFRDGKLNQYLYEAKEGSSILLN